MTVGSLFSGVGGMDLGFSRAGYDHAFLCEADPWRRDVLARHWPGVPIYHDVRNVGFREGAKGTRPRRLRAVGSGANYAHPDPARGGPTGEHVAMPGPVDVLTGGFPCQDVSVAGRRAGLDGERSGLFYEFARVADVLVRPGGWVLIENVPGLLSSQSGRDFAVVLATLAELGFMDGAWRVLDARWFGVPQRRRRVFLVARRAPHGTSARQVLLDGAGGPGDPRACRTAGPVDPNGAEDGPAVARALTGHGNGLDASHETLVVSALDRQAGGPDDNSAQAGHITPTPHGVRRLTPTECERLMGWPDDWTAPGPDSRRYAACGDGVVAPVAEWIARGILAVEARYADGVAA